MKKVFLLLMLMLLATGFVFAKGDGDDSGVVLVFASDATWPPMEYVDESGDLVGFDIDMIHAIADAAGFEVEVRNTAWDGIFAGLLNGAYDGVISSVTITEERMEAMDFSVPYINAGQILIVRSETSGVSSLSDMSGKKVGAQMGTTGDFAIEEAGVDRRAYDEIGLAIEDLINGNLDGVVCDSPIAADFVLNNPAYKGKLKIVGEPFTEEQLGIAVKKGNDEVLALINAGLEEVIANGTRDELVDKWLR